MELGSSLTRKLGPLPVWAWGTIGGGALYLLRKRRAAGSTLPTALDANPPAELPLGYAGSQGLPSDAGFAAGGNPYDWTSGAGTLPSGGIIATVGPGTPADAPAAAPTPAPAGGSTNGTPAVTTPAPATGAATTPAPSSSPMPASVTIPFPMTGYGWNESPAPGGNRSVAAPAPAPARSPLPAPLSAAPHGLTPAVAAQFSAADQRALAVAAAALGGVMLPPPGSAKAPAAAISHPASAQSGRTPPPTQYETYRARVTLAAGQTVHFSPGKGYYAA